MMNMLSSLAMPQVDCDFVAAHINDDPARLRLSFCARKGITPEERQRLEQSILQIECRRKYAPKFRSLLKSYPDFIFPSALAAEQASHFWVSRLHSYILSAYLPSILSPSSPPPSAPISILDMTAGLGVDFICNATAFGNAGAGALAAEIDPLKAATLRHNLNLCNLAQANVECGDSLSLLHTLPEAGIGVIFADPARRGESDRRLYDPTDCMPDVVGHWDELLSKGRLIMVKNSPMLDPSQVLRMFPGTVRLLVVSVRNECKEVLVLARRGGTLKSVETINIIDGECIGDYSPDALPEGVQWCVIPASEWHNDNCVPSYAESAEWMENTLTDPTRPLYLYEPNASLMKCAPWRWLTDQYPTLLKASPNCHLFISSTLYSDFPGRRLRVTSLPGRRDLPKSQRFNIVSRNHPLAPEALARKMHLRMGGDRFLYALTLGRAEQPTLLLADPTDS